MNCALWLNKQKVQQASEIPDNLDVASLRGYFLAGSLVEWLRENGGEKYAEKLSKISADDPQLNLKIADIFGGKPLRSKPMRKAAEDISEQPHAETAQNGIYGSAVSSYGVPSSAAFGSAGYGSSSYAYLTSSSFGGFWEFLQKIGTSSFGSFGLESFSQWEWLFSLFGRGYGSFYFGSFGSFHEWEWEWLFRLLGQSYGSFYSGSFGSFREWEWEWLFRLFSGGGSFSVSSFGSFYLWFWNGYFGSGSFGILNELADIPNLPVLDEYDRIMLETLMRCPLDRFGYGVHNI